MADDFTALRTAVTKLRDNPFRHGWQFHIEIGPIPLEKLITTTDESGNYTFPPDPNSPTEATITGDCAFDMYVKDVTYDPITIEMEAEKIGGHTFNFPIAVSPTTITMTMRDHSDRRIYEWFKKITNNIIDTDGTIKPIGSIEFLLKKYNLDADGKKDENSSFDSWYVIPTKLGEITESRQETGNIEFPIVFVQSRTNKS